MYNNVISEAMKNALLFALCAVVFAPIRITAQDYNHLWVQGLYGSTVNVEVFNLAVNGDGEIFACGNFSGSVDFDPGPNTYTLDAPSDESRLFMLKLNSDGSFAWAKSDTGNGSSRLVSVTIDPFGNAVFVGNFSSTLNVDGSTLNTAFNASDFLVVKTTSQGDLLWVVDAGSDPNPFTESELLNAVDCDATGNIYAAGSAQRQTSAGVTYIRHFTLRKLSANGGLMASFYSTGETFATASDMVLDKTNNAIHVLSSIQGAENFSPLNFGDLTTDITQASYSGSVYVTFNTSLVPQQILLCQGSFSDRAEDITLDEEGKVYISGRITPGFGANGLFGLQPLEPLTSGTFSRGFVAKIDPASSANSWVRIFANNSVQSNVANLDVDPSGTIYAWVYAPSGTDLDPGSGVSLSSVTDMHLVRLDEQGNFIDFVHTPNTYPSAVKAMPNGEIVHVGVYNADNDFDYTDAVAALPAPGNMNTVRSYIHKFATCSIPSLLSLTSPIIRCGPGIVTLEGSVTNGTIDWYSEQVDGSLLASGTNAEVEVTESGFIWAEAVEGLCKSLNREFVGITLLEPPVVVSVSGAEVCEPGTVELSAEANSPSVTLYWFDQPTGGSALAIGNTLSVNLTSTTNYYVEGEEGICVTPERTLVEAVLQATPSVSIAFNGSSLIASATQGVDYQWIDCNSNLPINGAQAATFTPAANGEYAVIVALGPCETVSECVEVSSLSVDHLASTVELVLSPNPMQSAASVRLEGFQGAWKLDITSLDGRLAMHREAHGERVELSREVLQSGVYVVTARTPSGQIIAHRRLVVY